MAIIHTLKISDTGIFSKINWTIIFLAIIWFYLSSCNSEAELTSPEILIKAGTYEVSMKIDTTTRWYTLVIPTGYDHVQKRPLVLAFHPGNASMSDFYNALQGFRELAEEENWLMVFPNGSNTTDNRTSECLWNAVYCCGLPYTLNVDDVGFVKKLVETLQRDYKVDEKRIYATGRSNGGMLLHRLGAELWDIFAAIAPFAASAGGRFDDTSPEIILAPSHPLPILLMHGLNDASVKYNGGLSSNGIRYDISFEETAMLWVTNNGCDETVADTTIFDSDEGRTWVVDFSSCQQGAQVMAITVENSGHQLPRVANSGFDGTVAIVQFFKSHSKN